ncbi:hypothetical protein MAM1_0008c00937 [Mucor ambiguus]|uniref:Uncharacterized protein n=1 Tax=Mucor ambiguus TaxID=91626 RepID=A0A0C9M528_9FUNG|nr:hypothetical protein MAM1_0008c00937 [Mucor ambiguus]
MPVVQTRIHHHDITAAAPAAVIDAEGGDDNTGIVSRHAGIHDEQALHLPLWRSTDVQDPIYPLPWFLVAIMIEQSQAK